MFGVGHGSDIESLVGLAFFKFADVFGGEDMPSCLLAVGDDGKPDAYRVSFDLRDMEAVTVASMTEDKRLHIKGGVLLGFQSSCANEEECNGDDDTG